MNWPTFYSFLFFQPFMSGPPPAVTAMFPPPGAQPMQPMVASYPGGSAQMLPPLPNQHLPQYMVQPPPQATHMIPTPSPVSTAQYFHAPQGSQVIPTSSASQAAPIYYIQHPGSQPTPVVIMQPDQLPPEVSLARVVPIGE